MDIKHRAGVGQDHLPSTNDTILATMYAPRSLRPGSLVFHYSQRPAFDFICLDLVSSVLNCVSGCSIFVTVEARA